MKDQLPDAHSPPQIDAHQESPEAAIESNIHISFDFILNNFVESMRLWCRIQTSSSSTSSQATSKDRAKREKEKQDLSALVGANLVRLSQLEGLTWEFYENTALPKLLEQLMSTKDSMAQQYLLDCIIQVFPDEFHLKALEKLLEACLNLQPGVDVKQILRTLMKRLSRFVGGGGHRSSTGSVGLAAQVAGVDTEDVFNIFRARLSELMARPGGSLEIADLLDLELAFLGFTLTLFPTRLDYVDSILSTTEGLLLRYFASHGYGVSTAVLDATALRKTVDILQDPISHHGLAVLALESYKNLSNLLPATGKTIGARKLANIVAEQTEIGIDQESDLRQLLSFLQPLVVDQSGDSEDQVEEDMEVLSKVLQKVRQSEDLDKFFAMCSLIRGFLGAGGALRIKLALPPLLHKVLDAIPIVRGREMRERGAAVLSASSSSPAKKEDDGAVSPKKEDDEPSSLKEEPDVSTPAETVVQKALPEAKLLVGLKKYFLFLHKTVQTAFNTNAPSMAVQFWLKSAAVANSADANTGEFREIAAEFLTQALTVYEEELKDAREQFQAINLMVSVFTRMSVLEDSVYETFATRLTKQAVGLAKKAHQCRGVELCSHLFWTPTFKSPERVVECLQRTLKIAEAAVAQSPGQVGLFLEVLDAYVYYVEAGCASVTVLNVNMLVQICREQVRELERKAVESGRAETAEDCQEHFRGILEYLKMKKQEGGLWGDINVGEGM